MSLDNHPSTEAMQAADAAHHLHPFSDTNALNERGARVITRARGVFLTDSDGNEFLDAMAGLWCVNIGYGRDELAEAAARQMKQLPYYNTFFMTSHPPVIALSEKIAQVTPEGMNRVFYAGSGSEANDTNIRFVRHYWAAQGKPEKRVIISRKNAYHGSSMGSASLGGMQAMHSQGGLPIADIHHIDQPYWYAEGGDSDPLEFGLDRARALERAIEQIGADKIAAFIGEPVQGAGGVIIPPSTYWPEIQRICRAHDILLIADEVICGFGRTGNWFGSETFDIKPDLMTIAKGMTSGYLPMGGSVVRETVAQAFADHGGEFNHGYTYNGHPASAAVSLENIRIMEEENLVDHVRDVAAPHVAGKWAELGAHPLVGEARICGMMGALELSPDKAARAPFKAERGTVGVIAREHCLANGLVMRAVGDTMIISPPLCMTTSEIDLMAEKIWKVLDLTAAEIKAEGIS